ncbi:hypothetical protein [Actinacidiphila glaucinigra]|uniref:hypothetical protein n=1 Tax=Actinacidiphila glaucinigra TaxID=235986 RepID=UPI0035D6A406
MTGFAKPFKLHTPDGRVSDGVEFPSQRVIVLDDPEFGLWAAARTLDDLLDTHKGCRVEWPDGQEPACPQP